MRKIALRHSISRNHTVKHPNNFIFFDTETRLRYISEKIIEHDLMLGVAIYVRKRYDIKNDTRIVYRFTDEDDFWEFVESKSYKATTLYLIAHNILFDLTVLKWITQLSKRGWLCSFVFEQGMTFIAKWKKDNKTIIMLDNANWFIGKLEKWGSILGLAKLEMPEYGDSKSKWFEYCERDVTICEQLQHWLINFLVENDLGTWKMTLASTSFNCYRHRFMKHPIYIPDSKRENELARQSYTGGRTECFKVGKFNDTTYYKLDINSMYPFVMKRHLYPNSAKYYATSISVSDLEKFIRNYGVIAKVTIKTNIPWYFLKGKERSIYPIGTFTTTLCTPEILMALRDKSIVEVHEVVFYSMRPLFSEFVDYFYEKRMEFRSKGDNLRSYMFKIFLNSLYGKFGQRGYKDSVIGKAAIGNFSIHYGFDVKSGNRYILRQVGENILRSEKSGEGYNSFVAIASHVTAYARIYLYALIRYAGRENVYYSDTDSLIVNSVGYERLRQFIDNEALGMLKCEGVCDSIEIVAPKHYRFGDSWTMKGVRKNAREVGQGIYEQEHWPRLNKLLQYGREVYYNYVVRKVLTPTIKSGIITSDGTIAPYKL